MSEVIVRMEMPRTCEECPIGNYFHTNCHLQDDDKSYEQFQAYKKNERPSWCPIIGVLPEQHGELIDKRELLKKGIDMSWSVQKWVQEVDIVTAKAIVPATERNRSAE